MNKLVPVEHPLFANAPCEVVMLVDKNGILTLQLEDEIGHQVEILFDDYIYYSKMDEGDALRSLELIQAESCVGHTLVLARNSDLMTWVAHESLGVRSVDQLQHYMILALNDVINVIAMSPPQISERAIS